MKDKNKLKMMNAVDDELIDRANPDKIKPKKRHFSKKMGMLAACLVIAVVAVNLAIFLPMGSPDEPPIIDPDASKPSEVPGTYEEIKAIIDAYNYKLYGDDVSGTMDSNAQMNGDAMGGDSATPPGAPEMDSDGSYVEVTDNQVDGVIEADLFKRTQSHIFYLRSNGLYAYTIDKENSKLVGEIAFTTDNFSKKEMYLSPDGKTATIIYTVYTSAANETRIVSIDVSKPNDMKILKKSAFKGSYLSSRYVNGELLLFTRFSIKNTNSEQNYIPSVDTGDGFELLEPDRILAPQAISQCSYLTVSKLTGKNLSYGGSVALLSYGTTTYVSSESIYATRQFYYDNKTDNIRSYGNKTEIARIDYSKDLLTAIGTVTVSGTVKDQYCMDEHEGILRVFTSINQGYYTINTSGSSGSSSSTIFRPADDVVEAPTEPIQPDTSTSADTGWATSSAQGWATSGIEDRIVPQADNAVAAPMSYTRQSERITSASLYCIDIENMQVVASVEKFAPQGETVQSARFDGDTAYVCTAIVFTDPVFVFDLSDLEHITYKDTGVIEGYSHSLIELEGGYLLGIGQTGWHTVKLELYKETDTGLSSVSKLELENTYSTTEYKAIYVNREEMIFGFANAQYGEEYKHVYSVFKIESNEITVAMEFDINEKCAFDYCRGVLVEDYFYVLTDAEFEENFNFAKIK